MLPPGTLKALKGHPEAIVALLGQAAALTALVAGVSPWSVVAVLAISLAGYHIRCKTREGHDERIAEKRCDEAALRIEAAKVRHRQLPSVEQPRLPFDRAPGKKGRDKESRR